MSNSKLIINTLEESATALKNQNQDVAIDTLKKITTEVAAFQKQAENAEKQAAKSQKETTAKISEIIVLEAQAHDAYLATKRELDIAHSKVISETESIASLNQQIAINNVHLANNQQLLRANQARMDDLNDKSAGSIVLSILSLGIDRAVKAIAIEVDGVKSKISNYKNTIASFNSQLAKQRKELAKDKNDIINLKAEIEKKRKRSEELKNEEANLNNQEDEHRKKLVFFTEVNMFYIKIQNLLSNISNRINDVKDIVEILDDDTPTITSFDPTNHDLLTLKEAILLFGDTLDKKVA